MFPNAFVRTRSELKRRKFYGFDFSDGARMHGGTATSLEGRSSADRATGISEHIHRVDPNFSLPVFLALGVPDRVALSLDRLWGRIRYRNNISQVNAPCFVRKRLHTSMLAK
jgi:hypothetical protein